MQALGFTQGVYMGRGRPKGSKSSKAGIPKAEEMELITRAQAGDLAARNRVVEVNLPFAIKRAFVYAKRYSLDVEDLTQVASMGLIKAVEKFEVGRDVKLITYAVWWIDALLRNHAIENHSSVKFGRTQTERHLFSALPRARQELRTLGVEPTDERVAEYLNVDLARLQAVAARLYMRDVSLDAPIEQFGNGLVTHLDQTADERPGQEERYLECEAEHRVSTEIEHALRGLPARERFVVEECVLKERTLAEIGADLHVSRERVRQIRDKVLRELRGKLDRFIRR